MTSFKGRRDIIGELFSNEGPVASVQGLEELESLINICVRPSGRSSGIKKLLPLKSKPALSTKKTTHYLNEEVFAGLTQANQTLKRLLPDGKKSKASKSKLVNYALNRLLQDIEEGKENSIIRAILESNK